MTVNLKSMTRCESIYTVGEHELRLWAIVGGQLAVSFNDGSFQERKNQCPKYEYGKSWEAGPTVDDLEGGSDTLRDFVTRNVPKQNLRRLRIETLKSFIAGIQPDLWGGKVKSRRFHDTDNNVYCYCEFGFPWYVPPVTVISSAYAGRCDEAIDQWATKEWKELRDYVNPMFDRRLGDTFPGCGGWEDLGAEQFAKICGLLGKAIVS